MLNEMSKHLSIERFRMGLCPQAQVRFTPTVPTCSVATLIGLTIKAVSPDKMHGLGFPVQSRAIQRNRLQSKRVVGVPFRLFFFFYKGAVLYSGSTKGP